ncbi:MAG: hypothetical protein HQL38_06415 [Alphaproteobacteria bacterium]|nr:hypothetical protein [Alphaproteobacteria bacterium]
MQETDDIIRTFPPFYATIARVAGIDAALTIAKAWGGTMRYIPRAPNAKSPWTKLVGQDAAARIIAAIGAGPDYRYIPVAPAPLKKLAILRHDGPARQTAMALGCTDRYVRMVRNAGRSPAQTHPTRPNADCRPSNGGLTGGSPDFGYLPTTQSPKGLSGPRNGFTSQEVSCKRPVPSKC